MKAAKQDTAIIDSLFSVEDMTKLGQKLYALIMDNVLTWASLLQLIAILLILGVSWTLARRVAHWIDGKRDAWSNNRNFVSISALIHISGKEIAFLMVTITMLWITVLIADAAKISVAMIRGWASLMTAWGIIRFSSSLIQSKFWSTTLALVMWSVAALNILGWLNPTVEILDNAAINLGKFHLSILLVIKGAIVFSGLLWLTGLLASRLEKALDKSQALSPSQKVLFFKLLRIALFILVIVLALNAIGIDFTALAVFSGALGIGVGFGLQKVFANLVSGFILLMDRSIKPGDVIAVGSTYGWVNRLGARYVSIITRDGKEHLIPNENLITERVENWSYSNDQVRIHIPVGISYNSDVHKARELMLEAVKTHPRILKYPAPTCLMMGFGSSSVDYELRVWINDPANGVSNVKSDIYHKIWDLFKEHKIEIPFPQQDVYIKSFPPEYVRS